MVLTCSRRTLSRGKALDFLESLVACPDTDGDTLYLPQHPTHSEVEQSLQEMPVPPDTIPPLADIIEKAQAGAVVFWGREQKYLVLPPFPIAGKSLFHGFSPEILHSLLKNDYTIALMLVRLGAYAVGVCSGEHLISSKVGTGNIHGRHKKGGSSAHRFERHRDKQIEYFFTRVCRHAREHLEPQLKTLDYLVYGGARTTIRELLKQCSFLGGLDTPTLPPLLDIPEPRQTVLQKALRRIWSSTLYEWREEG